MHESVCIDICIFESIDLKVKGKVLLLYSTA